MAGAEITRNLVLDHLLVDGTQDPRRVLLGIGLRERVDEKQGLPFTDRVVPGLRRRHQE